MVVAVVVAVVGAVVVAQLVEQSLPTPEILCSNPNNGKNIIYQLHIRREKTKINGKRARGWLVE